MYKIKTFNVLALLIVFINNSFGGHIDINKLQGLWRIESFIIINNEGVKHHWAEEVNGTLFYSKGSFMTVSINGKSGASNKTLFYSGTYQVNSDDMIIHHVLNASDPMRINKKLPRKATLDSGILTMAAKGDYGTAILKWHKMKL